MSGFANSYLMAWINVTDFNSYDTEPLLIRDIRNMGNTFMDY